MKTAFRIHTAIVTATAVMTAVTLQAQSQSGSSASETAPGQSKSTASSFIKEAAQGNAAEIALAEVAERKAQNKEVKDFAQHVRKDHSAANQELQQIASKHNVEINQPMDSKHQRVLDEL